MSTVVESTDIIDAAGIRDLAGIKQRQTFIEWRKKHGFPAPLQTQTRLELWDKRDVEQWLKDRRPT